MSPNTNEVLSETRELIREIQTHGFPIDDPSRHEGAVCAFCLKPQEQAGPLVESAKPGVYLCYECAKLVVHIIEEECKRRDLPAPDA